MTILDEIENQIDLVEYQVRETGEYNHGKLALMTEGLLGMIREAKERGLFKTNEDVEKMRNQLSDVVNRSVKRQEELKQVEANIRIYKIAFRVVSALWIASLVLMYFIK